MIELQDHRQIMDALYGDGDSAAAARSAETLSRADLDRVPGDSVATAFRYMNRCALEQWRAWHGDTTGLRRTAELLGQSNDANMPWWGWGQHQVCAAVLEALRGVSTRAADASRLVTRLDSLLARGLEIGVRDPGWIASSRLHERLGDLPGALEAIRRRQYHHRTGVPFLASALRDEGRLALATGDSAGARAAWRHFLALRSSPEPALQAQANSVRSRLGSLN